MILKANNVSFGCKLPFKLEYDVGIMLNLKKSPDAFSRFSLFPELLKKCKMCFRLSDFSFSFLAHKPTRTRGAERV